MRIGDAELESLAARGESFRVERKESFNGSAPQTVREAVCAFANDLPNSNEPGVIFIGVRDDGVPAGLAITDALLRSLSDIRTDGNILPPPSMFVEMRTIRGSDIAVVTVTPSDSPPVRYKGAIHVRIGPRRGIATAQDESILNAKRRARDIPFDIQPVPGTGLSALDTRLFESEYLPNAFSAEALEANERTLEQRLATTKMIASADDTTATILGLLVIGANPQDFLPGFAIEFLRIDGIELSDPIIDAATIDGTLAEIVRQTDAKLRAHIRTRVDLTGSDREARSANYPLGALQQIIRNAVMHRQYEATNAPIRVTWLADRIEITSPGGPYGVVTKENFGRPGFTDYRNPNLADAMKVLGFVQKFGVGIATARRLLRENNQPALEYAVEDNFVQAIIREGPQ
jgi:ATP-dependent DNA helicase RecG